MKYLRKFATKADMADLEQPNVVLIGDTSEVLYNAVPNGVYIQHIDGKLYTTDAWVAKGFANDEANGVAVVASECRFVIAKVDAKSQTEYWGGYNKLIEGVMTSANAGMAASDCDGFGNTQKIVAQLDGYEDDYGTIGSPAADYCINYTFPNGKVGYLPALGEWAIARRSKQDISNALLIVGGNDMSTIAYWSSTQNAAMFAWASVWATSNNAAKNKATGCRVRAFTTL